MMSTLSRLIATGIIWAMTPLIIVAATDSAVRDGNAVVLVAIVMIAAALSTRSVWNAIPGGALEAGEKTKRTGSRRVRRLVESLTDDELDELRARLSDDGEVVPLDTLLAQQGKGR